LVRRTNALSDLLADFRPQHRVVADCSLVSPALPEETPA
jgi:hypothetical protein